MKVISLKTYRVFREREKQSENYRIELLGMSKEKLLDELLAYHELYQRNPHDIAVTVRGQRLAEVIDQRAEYSGLRELSSEFRKKLKIRLYQQMHRLEPVAKMQNEFKR